MQPYVTIPVTLVTSLWGKFHLRVAEWMTSAMLITLGAQLASHPTMFQSSAFFSELERFASQPEWATALFLIGFSRVSVLVINGAWRLSPHARALLACLSFMVWLEIVSGVGHVGKPTIGIAIFPWLAVADFYAIFRASGDARLSDDHARSIKAAVAA